MNDIPSPRASEEDLVLYPHDWAGMTIGPVLPIVQDGKLHIIEDPSYEPSTGYGCMDCNEPLNLQSVGTPCEAKMAMAAEAANEAVGED